MRFLIISHVVHKLIEEDFFAYGPYVKEMNLWFKHVDEVSVIAPLISNLSPDSIDLVYKHPKIDFHKVPEFNFLSLKSTIKAFFLLPKIFLTVFSEMKRADHIHLRCPGNMGLVACIAQVFFPSKIKSAKYAGNWDPHSKQPSTYRLQQKILSNEFFTRNIKVLVYGDWAAKNKNLLSFFTASYLNKDRIAILTRSFKEREPVQLLFVGSLHPGKNPMISCRVAKYLASKGFEINLHFYGEGKEREKIEDFIKNEKLEKVIFIHGNVDSSTLKVAYQKAHFLIFASESEGWPKVVAESMFWSCLPVTTPVSCVPQMIGNGRRGELVNKDVEEISNRVISLIENPKLYNEKCLAARDWSQSYTLERFETEIKKLLLG